MQKENGPFVSVLMCVYNGEQYLAEAISSVLSQSHRNFEFVIINDGSTDKTESIILSFEDERIRYVKNENNLKLIPSLNKGLSLVKGKYIVRMDADDICLPHRIEEQVDFLERHPDAGVVGCFVTTLDQENERVIKFKTQPDEIKFKLFFNNHVFHPTVVIRTSLMRDFGFKYENYLHAEDYQLWIRISRVSNIYIIPKVFLKYRIHGNNISVKNSDFQFDVSKTLRLQQINELGLKLKEREIQIYESWLSGNEKFANKDYAILMKLFDNLISKNKEIKIFNLDLFSSYFLEKAWEIACKNVSNGCQTYKVYLSSQNFKLRWDLRFKFLMKCFLRIKKV